MSERPRERDWTTGAAKWLAALVLGGASVFGMAWSIRTHHARQAAAQLEVDVRIDINRAGVAEMQLLPGIGEALAQRIVDDRDRHGPFPSVDGLARIHGIGPRTVAQVAPFAYAGEAAASSREDFGQAAAEPRPGRRPKNGP